MIGNVDEKRSTVDYLGSLLEEDPFPDPSFLDPLDFENHEEIVGVVNELFQSQRENGLPQEFVQKLNVIIESNIDIFALRCHPDLLENYHRKILELSPDGKPFRVKARK